MLNTKHIKVLKDIRPRKFAAPFEGPYEIIGKTSNNAYELALPPGSKIFNKFHISLLRPYKETPMHPPDEQPPPVIYDSNEYEVDKLLSHKKIRGRSHFLVLWTGYPRSMATWEPAHHIPKALINDFWKQYRKQERALFQ